MEITVNKSFTVISYMSKNNNRILLNSNSERQDLNLTFGFSTPYGEQDLTRSLRKPPRPFQAGPSDSP